MMNQVETILRQATRDDKELNILCANTHERQQSSFESMKHNFYLFQHPSFKEWKTKYAPVPKNHCVLNVQKGEHQLPRWVDFDLVLSQNKFGQFQILGQIARMLRVPLINVEHTLPPQNWPQSRIRQCREMMGDVDVFVSEYQRSAWGYPDSYGYINHTGIDTGVFRPTGSKRRPTVLSIVNDWINRDWCVLEDTEILTVDGYRAIADLSKYEYVLTDDGKYHQIIDIFTRNYDGDLIEIELDKNLKISFTEDHNIRVFRNNVNNQWKYLPAKRIRNGDVLRFPNHVQTDFTFNDYNFAWLIGLIIGDGHITKHGSIQISINKHDISTKLLAHECLSEITSSKVTISERQLQKGIYLVECTSKILGNWLREKIYDFKNKKRIPDFIINSSNKIRMACLQGLFAADGSFKNGKKCARFVFTNVSYTLASQVSSILHSLGVKCSINHERNSSIFRVVGYGKDNVAECKNIITTLYDDWFEEEPSAYTYTVTDVNCKRYKGKVYNCRVEGNESYVVYPGFVTHNCCGFNLWREVTGYPNNPVFSLKVLGDTPGLSLPAENIEQLVEAYNTASVYLNTTTISSLPTVILEAMACGCPVVSTATCLIPKIMIKHGENGFCSNDPLQLRSYCKQLLEDENLAREIGEAGRQTVLEKFSMKKFVDTWEEIFQIALRKS